MRTIIYSVINKNTNEKVFSNCRLNKCEEFINQQANKDGLSIFYKWMSF